MGGSNKAYDPQRIKIVKKSQGSPVKKAKSPPWLFQSFSSDFSDDFQEPSVFRFRFDHIYYPFCFTDVIPIPDSHPRLTIKPEVHKVRQRAGPSQEKKSKIGESK